MSFISSFTRKSCKDENNKKNNISNGCIDDSEYVENVSIGKYVIIKELGSGSTAKVVLAFEKNTNKKVAIKIIKRKSSGLLEDANIKNEPKSKKDSETNKKINTEYIHSTNIENNSNQWL